MPEPNSSSTDSVLGRLVVERGLATAEDVQKAIEKINSSSGSGAPGDINQRSLAHFLVAEGIVTRKQIERLRPEAEDRTKRQIPGFQLLEKLGAGAMATVYRAKQLSLDRSVAIKILPKKHTTNQQFVDRFYAEGRAAAKLNHPNIVAALDVGQVGDTHYFVMEYVEGKTVFDDITQKGAYSEEDAVDMAIQVARALEHAHAAGFVHRDVKPKNIMITPDGTAKLADMGLARAVSDKEAAEAEAGKAFGTPYYIAPEQIRGERDIDFRADIYSLGATLYHMVTGQVPFDGPNPSAVMHKHLKAELVPPDHLKPNLSAGMSEIIEVCMAKDRAQRYASTADLLQDLEMVARGEAPMQARKQFDLSSLATLDRGQPQPNQLAQSPNSGGGFDEMAGNPLFLAAVAGWLIALLLIVVVAVMASSG